MKIKKWIIAYFSPTGGTKKVADAVASSLDGEKVSLDLCREISAFALSEGEALIAFMPVYCGRVPSAALERLGALKGQGQPAAAVAVYGNREYDDALVETADALEACGFKTVGGAAFIAQHSVVRSVAVGRPDSSDTEKARAFGKALQEKISSGELSSPLLPGNRPYVEMKNLTVHPAAGESCTGCGICAEGCPVGAIKPDSIREAIHGKCINCMRCVMLCPVGVRSMPEDYLAGSRKMLSEKAAGRKEPNLFL